MCTVHECYLRCAEACVLIVMREEGVGVGREGGQGVLRMRLGSGWGLGSCADPPRGQQFTCRAHAHKLMLSSTEFKRHRETCRV